MDELLTAREAADYRRTSIRTQDRERAEGRGPQYVRIGAASTIAAPMWMRSLPGTSAAVSVMELPFTMIGPRDQWLQEKTNRRAGDAAARQVIREPWREEA